MVSDLHGCINAVNHITFVNFLSCGNCEAGHADGEARKRNEMRDNSETHDEYPKYLPRCKTKLLP